MSAVKFINEII